MIGAIIGDICGSPYEWNNHKSVDFPLFSDKCRFTDDTVTSCAIAQAILDGSFDYQSRLREICPIYRKAGYGKMFADWIVSSDPKPYNSWGNGSSMRVSACGFAASTLENALEMALQSAMPTHNHPDAIAGAQSIAGAIYMARKGSSKLEIKNWISETFGYDLNRTILEIRPKYKFDVSCKGSVPEAIIAFLESSSFEEAIRLAISIGGDSDTIACIAGGLAQAFYKEIPDDIVKQASLIMDDRIRNIVIEFSTKFPQY